MAKQTEDDLIRDVAGYVIAYRPRTGAPIWRRHNGSLVNHVDALAEATSLKAKMLKDIEDSTKRKH